MFPKVDRVWRWSTRRSHAALALLGTRARGAAASLERLGLSENAILLAVAVVIGLVSAAGVVGFYALIDLAYVALYRWTQDMLPDMSVLAYRPLLTSLALIIATAVMQRLAPGEAGLTVPDIQLRVARRAGDVPLRPALVRTAASAVTIGGGGSAGSEGPVAVLGAAVGSSTSRFFRFAPQRTKVLTAAGVAAGISAAFNAPLAGAFFALEEILGTFSVGAFAPVVVSSVLAAVTSRAVLGNHPAFPVLKEYGYVLAREVVIFYPLLGVIAGLAGVLFVRSYFAAGDRFQALRLPPLVLAGIGGIIVGALVVLSGGLLLGKGHLAFDLPALTRMAWYALAGLALLKMIATTLTLHAGGSGGLFAPTLFVGGAVGAAFGALLRDIAPGMGLQVEAYALVGMGALLASALGAPLTGILLVFELTNDYAIMLPLMVTVAISAVVARRIEPDTLYSGWLRRKGEHLEQGASKDVLSALRVADVYDREGTTFHEADPLARMLERVSVSDQSSYPVVRQDGGLIGVIAVQELARLAREETTLRDVVLAADIASPSETLLPGDSLLAAMRRMGQRGVSLLPVVEDRSGRFLGVVTRAHLLATYERALLESQDHAIGPKTGEDAPGNDRPPRGG